MLGLVERYLSRIFATRSLTGHKTDIAIPPLEEDQARD